LALVLADRVQETTTTTGTGTLTLAGAVVGFQSFIAIGNANTTYYTILSGADWEVGIGTYTLIGTTLSRDIVLSSSAAGAKIAVVSGAFVFCGYPAGKSVGSQTGYFDSTYKGTFVDGIVLDYDSVSASGRISVGGADGIKFYNNGVAGTLLGEALNNGNWDFNGSVIVGLGTAIGGATNPLVSSNGSANNYVQTYVHNDNTGISASADLVAYPDNGTDASGWIDMGIASSGYADTTFTCTGPNEGYLFMSALSGSGKTGNLVYATDSTGTSNAHQWYCGGFTQAKSAYNMQLNASGLTVSVPFVSTVATGTAPFTITSTTQVTNLNASTLGGSTFAVPSAIGATTPNTGKFTTVTYSAGTASVAPIVLTAGTNLTAAAAGAVEFDTANTIAYFTGNTTNGRGIIPNTNYFRLAANGAATATTISPFFGTTSSIPLVANGVYEIEINAYFLKNTAGTLVWTITNSAVVTNMVVDLNMSAITGIATIVAPLTSALVTQTAAAVAFPATGSLTTAVNHFAKFKIILENASSTSVRLNVTNSAGTVTPLRGSFWKATRITNAGTYAA
jgi:hypothetical protein